MGSYVSDPAFGNDPKNQDGSRMAVQDLKGPIESWSNMPAKILRRCTICKNFHAAYLVEDPELGKCYLCLRCWKARSSNKKQTPPSNESTGANTGMSADGSQSSGKK